MPLSSELESKLAACDAELRMFVEQLLAENARAQTRIAKLEARGISNENKIAALEKDLAFYIDAFRKPDIKPASPTHDDYLKLLEDLQKQADQKDESGA